MIDSALPYFLQESRVDFSNYFNLLTLIIPSKLFSANREQHLSVKELELFLVSQREELKADLEGDHTRVWSSFGQCRKRSTAGELSMLSGSKPDFDRLRSSCWNLTVFYSAQGIREPS